MSFKDTFSSSGVDVYKSNFNETNYDRYLDQLGIRYPTLREKKAYGEEALKLIFTYKFIHNYSFFQISKFRPIQTIT